MIIDGKYYVGDSSVSRLYQGANLVYDSSHPDILLDYLANGPDDSSTSSRNVYFDTDFIPTALTTCEVKYQLASTATGIQEVLFGCNYNDRNYFFLKDGTNTSIFWYRNQIGGINVGIRPDMGGIYDTSVHVFRTQYISSNQIAYTYDASEGTVYYSTYTEPSTTAYLSVFARKKGDSSYDYKSYGGAKIYYLKFWDNKNLVRFYIPVLHYINGQYTPCFYDKVNDTYIYNLGTDTPTYKMSEDYLLDYIGSGPENAIPDNRQVVMRYDSGVVASNQLQTDMRGRLVWGRENYLFGSGTSNQTTPSWQPYGYCTVGGSTDADKMRLRMGMGASSTSNYGMYLSTDASTVVGVNTLSAYFDASRGYVYLNGTRSNTSSPVPDTFSSNTIHLFSRHGDATNINALGGSRIYFINFTISNVPAKTFIPVLHNGQATFLDLNSGTYIYNIGTATPYYILKS